MHTMLVFGTFFTGGSSILFGLLEFMTLPAPSDKDTDVVYLVTVIVLRVAGGVGVSAVVTSAMGLLAVTFTRNTTTVLVGKTLPKPYLLPCLRFEKVALFLLFGGIF